MQMTAQLHHALSDITGVTGLSILRAIVSGEYDPSRLIQYRDIRCKKTPEILQQALKGNWQPEHLLHLNSRLHFSVFTRKRAVSVMIKSKLHYCSSAARIKESEGVLPSARHRTKPPNQLTLDVIPLFWKIS